MLAIVLLGLIACDSAASFKFRRVNRNHDKGIQNFNTQRDNHKIDILIRKQENMIRREGNLNNEIMNINRQQEDLNRQMENIKKQKDDLQRKTDFLIRQKEQLEMDMAKLDADMERINEQKINYAIGIVEGNEFKITIQLSGYNEEDILVKSKKGLLIVQAVNKVPGKPKSKYFKVRILPDFVEGSGRWLYKWGVLKIAFPIIQHLNKYPKLTIPLDKEQLSEKGNERPNVVPNNQIMYRPNNQNPASNITKQIYIDSPTTNSTKITNVPNQEKEVKPSNYISSKENGIEEKSYVPN